VFAQILWAGNTVSGEAGIEKGVPSP